MPTSNQPQSPQSQHTSISSSQTDTNNNSNNKIINGRSTTEVAVALTSVAAVGLLTATGVDLGLAHGNNLNHNHHHQTDITMITDEGDDLSPPSIVLSGAPTSLSSATIATNNTTNNTTTTCLKQSVHQQQPQHQRNTKNNNNNNNTNNIHNHNSHKMTTHISNISNTNHHVYVNNNNNHTTSNNHYHEQQSVQQKQQQQQHKPRSCEELKQLIKDINFDRTLLSNEELIILVKSQQISVYKLESFLGKDNAARCIEVRRDFYRMELAELDELDPRGITDRSKAFNNGRYEDLDYELVNGACCENVIGHVKVPVGLAGPLILDGEEIFVPLATTEGCLVASTCRGLSALRKSGGVTSRVRKDFMTRAPIIRFIDCRLKDALDNVERALVWLNDKNNKEKMRSAFNLTSSHGKFLNYTMYPVNREIHIRFEAGTGDAMGMNMCSKGVESALKEMQRAFPTMEIVTLSGNMCTDKKAAGINWINGRGKSVECNAELPAHVVQQVFKVSVDSMIDRWKSKVMVGSALAASIGGFNSQAANILTAIFIATGQDPAQNVTSSNCMLILEKDSKGSLVVCCTMPSIECGTVGGGTILADQSRYLQMMGVKGPTPTPQQQAQRTQQHQLELDSKDHVANGIAQQQQVSSRGPVSAQQQIQRAAIQNPINSQNGYTNARKLARIICATVMAGELSLLAALTEGTLVKSHMRHNRSSTNVTSTNLAESCMGSIGHLDV